MPNLSENLAQWVLLWHFTLTPKHQTPRHQCTSTILAAILKAESRDLALMTSFSPRVFLLFGLIVSCPSPVLAFTAQAIGCYQAVGTKTVQVAINYCLVAARRGDMQSQYKVAVLYARSGIKDNIPESLRWLEEAANQGHTNAQYNLGFANKSGTGVPVDLAKALTWYRLAAEGGSAKAQRDIALMYETGAGVPRDQLQAFAWYKKSAEQGFADSQLKVGVMLLEGQGAEVDVQRAEEWVRLAALAGEADAQYVLASFLWKRDAREAEEWYRKAIDQNHQHAMFSLARSLYLESRDKPSVTAELERALAVASKAVISGHTESVGLYNEIAVTHAEKSAIDESPRQDAIDSAVENQVVVVNKVDASVSESTTRNTRAISSGQIAQSAEPWFSQILPEHYTIQLVVSSSFSGVDNFIKKYNIMDTAQFHATRSQGKLVYIVTSGVYVDREAATAALLRLPTSLRDANAFVQTVGTLQDGYVAVGR